MLPYLGWAWADVSGRADMEKGRVLGLGLGLTHDTHHTAPSCLGVDS